MAVAPPTQSEPGRGEGMLLSGALAVGASAPGPLPGGTLALPVT